MTQFRNEKMIGSPLRPESRARWTKTARSLPEYKKPSLSREVTFSDDVDVQVSVPYRLPKISCSGDVGVPSARETFFRNFHSDQDDKIWSRYGYEELVRVPELGPVVHMLNRPPVTYAQQERQANLALPKFRSAAIAPSHRTMAWHTDREIEDVQIYKSMIAKTRERTHDEIITNRPEPTPSPISRSDSPAKSVKSIHWMLGSSKHPSFDNKGRSRNQGPYSREFTVTCIAPTNWLRMKWGRSKTMINS
ncbi:hypothetical protein KUTeg_002339 [Tegillarca granosa]|uniref:Uncharacterized protein n=1 Tax=Tegillarca granosa TaxID=220873 RepID=A0ABQ9FU24_TEGGR|nr:hypothetical protein KUTeg_002339 [Tegillarca granosa]